MKRKYNRNEGYYATVIKVLENGLGMILELDTGEEAYCHGYKSELPEESIVLCSVRRTAGSGRRKLVHVVDVVENVLTYKDDKKRTSVEFGMGFSF